MPPTRSDDPTLIAASSLTVEAAHARRLLDLAGRGPESTRGLVVDLMESLISQGYRNSVAWYLAPSPADDLHELIFSLQSSDDDDPNDNRWRDRRELASVLADARQLAGETDKVEVWSGNGHGVRRLVMVGGHQRPIRYVPPEPRYFAGADGPAQAAVMAWRDLDPGPAPEPVSPEVPGTPLTDAESVGRAVQEALGQVSVEVDLGSIEELVTDAVRSALAELPVPVSAPVPGLAAAAGAEDLGDQLRPVVQAAVTDAVDAGLAGQLRKLEDLVQRSMALVAERREPVRATAPALQPLPPAQALPPTQALPAGGAMIDPVDIARRVAASVLSPSEIAESMLFRLRPFMEDQSERLLRQQAVDAKQESVVLEQMRQGIERLTALMDRHVTRVEEELRRGSRASQVVRHNATRPPDEPASAPDDQAPLRVLRADPRT